MCADAIIYDGDDNNQNDFNNAVDDVGAASSIQSVA